MTDNAYTVAIKDILECMRSPGREMNAGRTLVPLLPDRQRTTLEVQHTALISAVRRLVESELEDRRHDHFGAEQAVEYETLSAKERLKRDFHTDVRGLQNISITWALYVHGLAKADIATTCNISSRTVDNRLNQANERLAERVTNLIREESSADQEPPSAETPAEPSASNGIEYLPHITDELQRLFVLVSMVVIICTAMVWPAWTIVVLLALISWRTVSNGWRALRQWYTRSSSDDDRLYMAYGGLWAWALCLALYTAASASGVSVNAPLWPRIAFVLQCLVVGGGLAVLGNADTLFAIYRRVEAGKSLGVLQASESRARRAWDRRWTIVHSFVFIMFLFSVVMVAIGLIGLIDIRVLF